MRARSTLDWSQSKIFLVDFYFYITQKESCNHFKANCKKSNSRVVKTFVAVVAGADQSS